MRFQKPIVLKRRSILCLEIKKIDLNGHKEDKKRLLEISFTTLNDYLWLLKSVCHELKVFGNKAMLYLAAAVSDFYIPNQVRR